MAILKDLIVHGSSRFLNKIYASEIQTPLIEAEAGIIKKLKADDATVVGLLDVKGQLHTSSWSNSNIATIDGSFYITPTIGSGQGTVAITSSTLNFTRKDENNSFAIESLYLGDNNSITWPQYSKVLVTGQIQLNGEWTPLGTLLGQISGTATAASITINNIKDNKKPPSNTSNVYTILVNSGVSSTDYRNLKISLYQRATSQTDFRPLGIYMTAVGDNGRTFLDIYGGVNSLNTTGSNYGGLAEPNVRIGNLEGLPNVGGQTPSGWGIYTDNGYFKGIIAADKGYIGSGSKYWVIANEEDLSNSENSRSYIYNGTNNISSTIEGIYLGTDGIRNYKDSTHYVTIKDGIINAKGVNLTGEITASSGSIGGWNIGTDTNKSLYYGNQTPGATTTNLILSPTSVTNSNTIGGSGTGLKWFISAGKVFGVTTAGALYATSGKIGGWVLNADGFYITNSTPGYNTNTLVISKGTASTKAIGGSDTTSKNWMISAGTGFGVTTTGALYANDAHISGEITATNGTIGGINIVNGALDVSSINIGNLSGEIGGRNLIINTLNPDATAANRPKFFGQTVNTIGRGTASAAEHGIRFTTTSNTYCYMYMGFTAVTGATGATLQGLTIGETYTFSCDFTCKLMSNDTSSTTVRYFRFYPMNDSTGTFTTSEYGDMIALAQIDKGVEKSNRFEYTFTIPEGTTKFGFMFRTATTTNSLYATGDFIEFKNMKLEKGNKATDWTPAPEDTQESINNAAKTATSYITYINANDGIKVHNAQDTLNYLQLNSDAISMFRDSGDGLRSDEVLRIDNTGIRIGKNEGPHFSLVSDKLMGYGNNNNIYFEVGKGDNVITQLFFGDGSRTSFEIGPLIKQVTQVKKENNILIEGTDYNIEVASIWCDIYFKEKPDLNSTITVTYKNLYKDFIYTVSSSSTEDVIRDTYIKIKTHKEYEAEILEIKRSGNTTWSNYNINNSTTLERENFVGIRLTSVPQAGAKIYYYEGAGTGRMLFLGTSTGQTGQNGDLFYFSSATVVNDVSPLDPTIHVLKVYSNTTTKVSYNEEYEGDYIYTINLSLDTGDQVKLSYNIKEHSDLVPDTITINYIWDNTHDHPANSMLSIPSVLQIISVVVNEETLSKNIDYITENDLKFCYLVFNTAPSTNEKIEIEFFTRKYNSYYDSTYFNFSNMNSEDAIKGIGAASFGSDNINKGVFCLAEGVGNIVTGYASHVEGCNNIATGSHTHVGGSNSFASGQNGFAHGDGLKATYLNSAAFGYYNSPDDQLFSIGKGGSTNAFSVNKDGDIQLGGQLLAGTTYTNKRPLFAERNIIWNVASIEKNSSWIKSISVDYSGYRPIGICGFGVYNKAGVGTNADWCIFPRLYIWHSTSDTMDVYVWNQNTSAAATNVVVYVKILYMATSVVSFDWSNVTYTG